MLRPSGQLGDTVNACTHLNLIALGGTRCGSYTHCHDCGYETAPSGHIWVPAGLDPNDPQVCARCNEEQSTLHA